jgi:hypothetical protein
MLFRRESEIGRLRHKFKSEIRVGQGPVIQQATRPVGGSGLNGAAPVIVAKAPPGSIEQRT